MVSYSITQIFRGMELQGLNPNCDTLFWLRRDLRLDDNAGLFHALKSSENVQLIFVLDKNILEDLPRNDARVTYIYKCLERLQSELKSVKSSIYVHHGTPLEFFESVDQNFPRVKKVVWNKDYEPYANQRDGKVKELLSRKDIQSESYKDHVVFETNEVVKDDGLPYTVFTPYANKWRKTLNAFYGKSYPSEKFLKHLSASTFGLKPLSEYGFVLNDIAPKLEYPTKDKLLHYQDLRDYPAEDGITRVSVHLRFGSMSIRKLFRLSESVSASYVNELIWRDFYQMILWHFPDSVTHEFKPKYAEIPWRQNEDDFTRWKNGNTGVALVDAGMRELNATGFMHNRVRMVAASFLVKNLLIDWRLGEAYFAEKLLDYELASNVGGWQWAASSGCDAAPYFRVFNPERQAEKFDPKLEYICKWVPENANADYRPMIDLKQSRMRCIETFKKALS